MPLRSCLELASDKSQKMLRAKALECISLVGMAVGKDIFREDAHAVMRFMQLMQARAGTGWHMLHTLLPLLGDRDSGFGAYSLEWAWLARSS